MPFNLRSPTELTLLLLLAKSEGRLQRKYFPTKQLFYKMRNENFIKADKFGFKITEKFKKDYISSIDKTATFSSTGSPTHEKGIVGFLKVLPPPALASVAPAATLAVEHKVHQSTGEYKAAVATIQQGLVQQRQTPVRIFAEHQPVTSIIKAIRAYTKH